MSKGIKIALGFLAALVIGGGGGFALGPISDSIAAHETQRTRPAGSDSTIRIQEAEGEVRMLAPDGGWIAVKAGDPMIQPSCIEANGVLSSFRASLGATQLSAGHGARVLIGEIPSVLQLDRGQLKVTAGRMTTYLPHHLMKIVGSNYGVWTDEDRVVIAVLEGEVEVTKRGDTAKYAGGREVLYTTKSIVPRVSEPQLTIQVTGAQERDNRRRIVANVPPNALVFKKEDDRYERVTVSSSGKFSVTLPGKEAVPGELIAFDAAGRSAHVGGTPQAVKAVLEGVEEETAEEPVAPPPSPAKEEKKEKKKKKRGPKPLVKPEATPPPLEGDDLPPVVEEEPEERPKPKKKAVTIEPEVSEDDDPTLREIEELQEEEEKVD